MFDLTGMKFAWPWVFALFAFVPLMLYWHFWKGRKQDAPFYFSNFSILKAKRKSYKEKMRHIPFFLRLLTVVLFIIALARPQSFGSGENVYAEGIDIALVLDISGSMLAEDFKPNRLEAAKKITSDFIDERTNDRIGLVIFSREAFTQCPLTIDYVVLKNLLKDIKSGMLEDGTAIGNALANGVNRLKDSKAKSKVMILLTDGVNNAGEVDPVSAAEIARTFGIRIYTIGVGTIGQAPYPFNTPFGVQYQYVPVEIDEKILKTIAEQTGGKYYRATGNRKLEDIYKQIDSLEKTRVEVTSYRTKKELFYPFVALGLLFLFIELSLSQTIFRKLP